MQATVRNSSKRAAASANAASAQALTTTYDTLPPCQRGHSGPFWHHPDMGEHSQSPAADGSTLDPVTPPTIGGGAPDTVTPPAPATAALPSAAAVAARATLISHSIHRTTAPSRLASRRTTADCFHRRLHRRQHLFRIKTVRTCVGPINGTYQDDECVSVGGAGTDITITTRVCEQLCDAKPGCNVFNYDGSGTCTGDSPYFPGNPYTRIHIEPPGLCIFYACRRRVLNGSAIVARGEGCVSPGCGYYQTSGPDEGLTR